MSSDNHLSDNRRHNVITASNAYAVIHDRKKLFRQMTFREPPFEGNEATEYGKYHEHIALSALEKELDDILVPGNKFMVHSELPFGASPDAFYNGLPVEIKCPFSQEVYPTIPDRYYYQVQLQLMVTNQEMAYFYVWTPEETKLEMIPFSKRFMAWYLPHALDFIEFVNKDEEPPRWTKKPTFNIGE